MKKILVLGGTRFLARDWWNVCWRVPRTPLPSSHEAKQAIRSVTAFSGSVQIVPTRKRSLRQ